MEIDTPYATLLLTEQEAVDLLNAVDKVLGYHYPEEDSYNPSMRSVKAQLEAAGAHESVNLPGGRDFL